MANYIGKIAAVGTINMSQIASGLNASARDVEKYARTVRSTIVSANSAAGRSFQEIFTPLQRLERALQAANTRTLDIKVGGSAERIRAIVGAANDIARPLAASQKQFTALSATIQNEFIGSLTRAQNAAQLAESAINRGQIKNAAGYERLKRVVDEARSSISRLGEAGSAVSGLATGRELRFQQAGFAAELQRTSALQSQASALPADARASGAVAQLVELQRREAEEAARLLAVLENVRNTRRGDAAAAQANLDAQTQRLSQVNAQLERQVSLSNEAVRLAGERATREREIEQNIGAATQLRSTTDATGRSIQQRVRDIAALREEEARRATAARDAAEADEIAAASARLRAQAASQLLGVLQQESQILSNQGAASTTDPTGRSIQQRVRDIAALREEEARRATAARDAAEADEIAAASARLRAQAASQLLGVLQQESQLLSSQGAASTTDPTGRSIQQRARDIARLNAATQAAAVRGLASRSEQRAGSDFASLGDAERGAADLFRRIETLGPQAFRQLRGEIEGLATAFATGFVGPVNVDFQRLLQSVQQLEGRAARLREASRLLVISDSEQSLINNQGAASTTDATGRSIQQRVRDIAALREEEARRATAARDAAEADEIAASSARLRAQAASQLLGVLQQESQLISNQGAASTTDATGRSIQQRVRDIAALREEEARRATAARNAAAEFRPIQGNATGQFGPTRDDSPESLRAREIRTRLGAGVADPTRQFAVLEGNIVRLKGEIAELPEPIRARFVPAIERATNELIRLQNSPRATGREIDAVTTRVENLRRTAQRASTALNLSSAAQVIDNAGLRAATGQIEAAQRVLVQVGDTAGGPVAQAYQRLVRQTQIFVAEGTIGTERARQQLSRLGEEVARTAAATGRIRLGTALREIQRGGDIARGAFGNAGLAIQQAAFAVDDFFSVTGGLDQRIRAAGNNLSQLGFILGSTQGLFAGIGISIGAQVIASLIRLAPIVREAEAQQQRFAAEIANANSALERQQQIAERLATAYRALGDSIAESGFSEEGRTASGRAGRLRDIAQIQGEQRGVIAEQASVGVQRLSAIRSDFERRLQDATDPAVATTFRNAAQSVQRDIVSFVRDVENSATDQLRRSRAAGGNVDRGLAADLEAATARRTTALASQAAAGGTGRNPAVDRLVDETDRLVAALTVARQRLQDEAAIDRAGVAQAVGDSLGRIQSAVSGVSGFTDVAQRANESASRLRQLIQDSTERPVDALIEQLGRFSRTLEEVAIATSSFSDSLDRAAGNLAREVETELTSRAERARRDANQVESRFGGGDRRAVVARFGEEQARDAAAAQTRNRRAIEEEINRLRGQFEAAAFAGLGRGAGGQQAVDIARQIQELRQIAADTTRSAETRQSATLEVDALQRRLSDLFDALPEAAALRRRADQGDIEAQRRQRSLELAARGGDLARSPAQQFSEELADGIAAIREFYSQLAEATTGVVDFASQNQAIQRLVEQSQIDLLRTPAEQAAAQLQQQFGQIAAVQQGLGRAGLADQGVLAARGDAARRRAILGITDIGLSEQQQFARQLESNLGDLEAQARGFLQIGDRQAAAAAVDNGQRNLSRQNAPLFAQFSDEVANAVLQGPSRAALQVSDASTTEGQRELNRLLRGDDSARDINLVELQKQSTFLQSIDSGISTLKERLGIAQ